MVVISREESPPGIVGEKDLELDKVDTRQTLYLCAC
jgi:hypothetical protein